VQEFSWQSFETSTVIFFFLVAAVSIECSFKSLLEVGVEESIVNAPLVSLQSKNTNNAKSEVTFKQLIRDL
jgi:hypothetical protein